MEKRKTITNIGPGLMSLYTEPEGQDYWLMPGETVEIRANIESPSADFEIEKAENSITVWPSNDMRYISTWSKDELLECGYQRPQH